MKHVRWIRSGALLLSVALATNVGCAEDRKELAQDGDAGVGGLSRDGHGDAHVADERGSDDDDRDKEPVDEQPAHQAEASDTKGELLEGVFMGGRVAGLAFSTPSIQGTTDADGKFMYYSGEQVTFAVGDLELGAVSGDDAVSALSLVPKAEDERNPRVNNILVLLQTLDRDGDLNTGIQISEEAAAIVSDHADGLDLDAEPSEFAAAERVTALVDALNGATVFTDTDPRPRKLRDAGDAREYFARATAKRRVVETDKGEVVGYEANGEMWQWLGIPYAKPPLGDLRWKPPEAASSWKPARDAVAWSDQAAQDPQLEPNGEGGMSEDCLYLNVTAPKNAEGLPVMVWFHGGSFTILTSNSKGYNNPDGLTNKEVVLVTVNHRLGLFGYLAHPLLVEDSSYGGSGNYGQMDLVMALQWVQTNIAKFGGDPESVTIFGQSGGCGKVTSLMNSSMAAGLFDRAICQSGTTAIDETSDRASIIAGAEAVGRDLFTRLEVDSVAAARELPWTAIIQSEVEAMVPRQVYRPTIDNHYMSKTYYEVMMAGEQNDVPLMLGATNDDYPSLIAGVSASVPFRAAHANADLFVYKFSRVPEGWAKLGIRSGHGGELPYVFNSAAMFVSNYNLNLVLDATGMKPPIGDLNGDGVTGTNGDAADVLASMEWGAKDVEAADTMMTVWTHFAKTGDPSIDGLEWPAYTVENDAFVEFGPEDVAAKKGIAVGFPAVAATIEAAANPPDASDSDLADAGMTD